MLVVRRLTLVKADNMGETEDLTGHHSDNAILLSDVHLRRDLRRISLVALRY